MKLSYAVVIWSHVFTKSSLNVCSSIVCGLYKIAYLNINSLRYKFCYISELLTANIVDMLFLSETKIDDSFTDTQFQVNNYHFWRANRTAHGGDIAAYEFTYVTEFVPQAINI
jgi:hypothetical protein